MKILLEPMKMEKLTIKDVLVDRVNVEWREDGHLSTFPVRLLRKACPCASCRVEREKAATNKLHVVKEVDDHFEVDDLEAVIRELTSRGVTFEEYETPKTVNFIAQIGPALGAWFKDPDGNVLGVRQGPVPAGW